jgi:hypothetical protein
MGGIFVKKILMAALLAGSVLGLPACSSREESESAIQSEPDVSPTAAPNVAFQYAYQFGLPDAAIAPAQEAHAAACEKLGIDRCRITGMSYQVNNREEVSGSLNIEIEAELARGFGKTAAAEVERRDGRLQSAEITGTDQTADLEAAAARERAATEVATDSGNGVAGSDAELRDAQRREALEARLVAAEARDQAARTQAKVKRTPMSFAYYGDAGGRGFAGRNPLRDAWYMLIDSGAAMVSFVLQAVAVALPWALLLLLGFLLYRSRAGQALKRWLKPKGEEAGTE